MDLPGCLRIGKEAGKVPFHVGVLGNRNAQDKSITFASTYADRYVSRAISLASVPLDCIIELPSIDFSTTATRCKTSAHRSLTCQILRVLPESIT